MLISRNQNMQIIRLAVKKILIWLNYCSIIFVSIVLYSIESKTKTL
jgi:hypothetical protein